MPKGYGVPKTPRGMLPWAATRKLLEGAKSYWLVTIDPDGKPHLVAMWYAVLDGEIWFETKAKSQKAVNLRRDPRITCLVEAGEQYGELRGVSIAGRAELHDDYDTVYEVG